VGSALGFGRLELDSKFVHHFGLSEFDPHWIWIAALNRGGPPIEYYRVGTLWVGLLYLMPRSKSNKDETVPLSQKFGNQIELQTEPDWPKLQKFR